MAAIPKAETIKTIHQRRMSEDRTPERKFMMGRLSRNRIEQSIG